MPANGDPRHSPEGRANYSKSFESQATQPTPEERAEAARKQGASEAEVNAILRGECPKLNADSPYRGGPRPS